MLVDPAVTTAATSSTNAGAGRRGSGSTGVSTCAYRVIAIAIGMTLLGTIVVNTRREVFVPLLVQTRTEVFHGLLQYVNRVLIHPMFDMRYGPSVHVTNDESVCSICGRLDAWELGVHDGASVLFGI